MEYHTGIRYSVNSAHCPFNYALTYSYTVAPGEQSIAYQQVRLFSQYGTKEKVAGDKMGI